ncbi:phosphonate C-P lyase system protein PhnH [Cochlodiniinecator piscidefendens]|uniref:phosphonate C-P lyase system protein PhnH n=1 Tax=Cochlodiniinecator piscidefendens TaxID=2715756 RepID=UPI00140BEB6B|nr:phosphonate C-P lyase system protein PhnH [Cochlodiniinecator piscidefendens]
MSTTSLQGGFDTPPKQSALAFRAALSTMARPGNIETLSGGNAPTPVSEAAATLLLTLCDQETPIYLAPSHDRPALREWIAFHIGAPFVAASSALFALGTWDTLQLTEFPTGTPEYPDRSTTLIVELETLTTTGPRLTGPGIKDHAYLSLPDVAAFQQNNALFPMGLDFYFTAGVQLAALPRSTKVEAN